MDENKPVMSTRNGEQTTQTSPDGNEIVFVRNLRQVYRQNWRQITSITPGLLLILCSGVHLLYVIMEIQNIKNILFTNYWKPFLICTAWFWGTPVGFILSAIDSHKLKRRYIYMLAAVIMEISGFLLIIKPATFLETNKYVIIGRFLAGVIHGLVLHTVLIHSGEMGIRSIRQLIIRPIGVTVLVGTALQKCIFDAFGTKYNYFVLPGIMCLLFALVALILSFLLTYESVPWLIRSGKNENLALETWLTLQNVSTVDPDPRIVREFNELKASIQQDSSKNKSIFTDGNFSAIIKCSMIRILSAVLMSPAVFALIALADHKDSFSVLHITLFRVLMAVVFLYFLVDRLSTDAQSILSVVWFGIKLVFISICVICEWSNWFTTLTWYCILISLIIAPPIFDFLGHVYLSELYPYAKKDWSIAISLIVEYLVHIALIATACFISLEKSHIVLLVVGAIMIILGLIVNRVVTEKELLTTHEERQAKHDAGNALATSSS